MRPLNLAVPKEFAPHLRIGTCSWKYDSWRGLIYPLLRESEAPARPFLWGEGEAPSEPLLLKGAPPSPNYLAEYAKHLTTVEVDQWFWSLFPSGVKLPDPATVKAYAESVPEGFLFAVKVPNAITLTHFYAHPPKSDAKFANQPNPHFLSLDLLHRFLHLLSPMHGAEKLGPLLFQFEYLNRTMPSRQAFLDRLHDFLAQAPGGFRYAVEIRNPNYLSEEFFGFLREHHLGFVFLEGYYMPHVGDLLARHDPFTADFAVVRLHGSDREEMEGRTGEHWDAVVEPKPEGLQATASIVRAGAQRGLVTFVYANNHYEGSAPLTLEAPRRVGHGFEAPHMRPALVFLAVLAAIALIPAPATAAQTTRPRIAALTDKTLVAWVYLANTTQRGGSALTLIDSGEHFDAIVFGEVAPGRWMPGSDFFRRTVKDQAACPPETADLKTAVQIAIAYRGKQVSAYRDGKLYSQHAIAQPQPFGRDTSVLFGLRYVGHMGTIGFLAGAIEEARIYDVALDATQIAALRPVPPPAGFAPARGYGNEAPPGGTLPRDWKPAGGTAPAPGQGPPPKPIGLWTFEDGTANDQTGTFPPGQLRGGARIADGKLLLNGSDAYMISESTSADNQLMFYHPLSKQTGIMWDTWLYLHDGTYHLYYLARVGGQWNNISMATSPDGVHWKELGPILEKAEGVTWIGTGSTWRPPNVPPTSGWPADTAKMSTVHEGKFQMNFSEWRGPRQTIFFAESADLLHWKRLGNEFEFKQDTRWYEENGRWDCIWTLARPDGGFYGYWTATPKPETGGRFGFGETLDGVTWKALKPPATPGVGEGEVGAIEKIDGRYYMLYGTGGYMVTLVTDRPEGPFLPAKKNLRILAGHTYFARFFPTPAGLLVNHHSIARNGMVYMGTLNRAILDAGGTLRLAWWDGNEKLKGEPIDARLPQPGPAPVAMLGTEFDVENGVILQGTLALPSPGAARRPGIYIECGKDSGAAILVGAGGVCEFGPMAADGSGFKTEKRVDREVAFGASVRFRLLLKHSLLEFYLDDLLIECYSLPAEATGRIGLAQDASGNAFGRLAAWHVGSVQDGRAGHSPR